MSSLYGYFNDTPVTVNGNQTITGKKRFINSTNEVSGFLEQPTVKAINTTITPTVLSYLNGLSSNAQQQINGINVVLTGLTALEQALQSIEPAPNATTVKFNDTIVLDNGTNNVTFNPLGIDLNNGSLIATWSSIIAGGPTSTLEAVLTSGNTATNSITLNGTTAEIQIDNSSAGGVSNPLITLNMTAPAAGVLVERVYNQRTAVTGEFARKSFHAKGSTGVDLEYARFSAYCPVVNTPTIKGRLDMSVSINGTMTSFLSCNGSTNQVDLQRPLHLNSNNIVQVSSISTQVNNYYGKNSITYYTGDGSFPSATLEDNLRFTVINEGVPDAVLPLAASFPGPWGKITCSADYNSSTYVGTDTGFIYFSSDGITWNNINDSFNGRVKCMTVFNGELLVGGDFTMMASSTPAFRIARVDSSGNVYQINFPNYMGTAGFNNEVRCFCASASGNLYVGGAFNSDDQNILSCPYIAILDGSYNLYCIDNSSGTGYGPSGTVNFIAENTSYAPNYFVIGGEFTQFTTAFSGGALTTYYNAVWKSNGSFDSDSGYNPYQVVGMNQYPVCITQNGNQFYIGGYFTGLPYGDYLAAFEWDGANYNLASNPYSATPNHPIIAVYQNGGIYWSQNNGEFFDAGNSITYAPYSSAFSWIYRTIWGQLLVSTESNSQDPVIAYYFFTSDVVTLTLTVGTIYNGATPYTGGIILYNLGASVELMFRAAYNHFYVLNQLGAGFF